MIERRRLEEGADGAERRDGEPSRLEMEAARRTHARVALIQQFHLESAFIGVPKLATILGLSPSTIWGYMREGTFFIRYRMFNKSPMVCLDDLVDWYCSSDGEVAARHAAIPAPAPSERRAERGQDVLDDAVAKALSSIGIDPASKRGSLRRA